MKTGIQVLFVVLLFFSMHPIAKAAETQPSCLDKQQKEHQVMGRMALEAPKRVSVHLEKSYIDGVKIVRVTTDHFISPENIMIKYSGWKLAKCSENDVYLSKKIDDISPVSKTAGVMGLKDGNVLTLYNGNPGNHQVIQTFFQIDINALEADAAERLNRGIRITDKTQYKLLLDALSKYAVNHIRDVQRNS